MQEYMNNMRNIKVEKRIRRHNKIRARVSGTGLRPRLSVFKSTSRIYAQLIDDVNGVTILGISDASSKGKTKTERARNAGKTLAEYAKNKKINAIVFDRGGFIFTGRVKAFADGVREGGIEF